MKCQEQFARNTNVHRDFAVFIEKLLAAKVSKVHVLAHSMGARMFCGAIHLLQDVFTRVDTSNSWNTSRHSTARAALLGGQPSLPLGSVILLHPEADLKEFVAKDFQAIRQVCSNIC